MKSKLALYQDCAILVALSGGLDSTVLLHALADFIPSDRLRAIHIHHGLSPHADQWQLQCETLCARLNIRLITECVQSRPQPGDSIEAWARSERYKICAQHLQDNELLMTAQHAQDQAETLLLALVRGSGPKGLSAMPLIKPFGRGFHVRPFLHMDREILLTYAKEQHLTWVHDESNDNQDYDRNFLRHVIMPALQQRWPSIVQTLVRVAGHCVEQEALIDLLLAPLWPQLQGSRLGTLSIAGLLKQDIVIQKALIRGWLAMKQYPMPGHKMLDEILLTLIPAAEDAQPQVAWGDISVRRYRDDLYVLSTDQTQSLAAYRFEWNGAEPLLLPHGAGVLPPDPELGACTVCFDQPGLGLKKFFQAQGIPPWERARIPLIYKEGVFVKAVLL